MKKIIIAITLIPFLSQAVTFDALSPDDAKKLGTVIWNNEADKRVDLLVFWSPYVSFLEVGIGHYIWYPQGKTGSYTAQFPPLCAYMKARGALLPAWLEDALKADGAPWQTREEFLDDKSRADELRKFLASTVDLQTQFMIQRLEDEWPSILLAAPDDKQDHIQDVFNLLRSTLLGTYTLVDYLNFKGSGLNPHEERNGQRWGLLQVLLDMPAGLTQDNVSKAFAISASQRLLIMIGNSAPHYSTVKYLAGWIKRVSTYARTNIFDSVTKSGDVDPL